jgi:hypothetical protein
MGNSNSRKKESERKAREEKAKEEAASQKLMAKYGAVMGPQHSTRKKNEVDRFRGMNNIIADFAPTTLCKDHGADDKDSCNANDGVTEIPSVEEFSTSWVPQIPQKVRDQQLPAFCDMSDIFTTYYGFTEPVDDRFVKVLVEKYSVLKSTFENTTFEHAQKMLTVMFFHDKRLCWKIAGDPLVKKVQKYCLEHRDAPRLDTSTWPKLETARRLAEIHPRDLDEEITSTNVLTVAVLALSVGLFCFIRRCVRKRNQLDD